MMDIGEAVEEVLRMIDVRSFTNQGHEVLTYQSRCTFGGLWRALP
jgi:hypothetical protein